jgi:hypothetical protein
MKKPQEQQQVLVLEPVQRLALEQALAPELVPQPV